MLSGATHNTVGTIGKRSAPTKMNVIIKKTIALAIVGTRAPDFTLALARRVPELTAMPISSPTAAAVTPESIAGKSGLPANL